MSAISPTLLLFSSPSHSQNLWSLYTPLAAVLAICIFESALSWFHKSSVSFFSVFRPLLSIHEAEALVNGEPILSTKFKQKIPLWLTPALSVIAFIEAVFWSSSFIRSFIRQACIKWGFFALALSWLYASVKPVLRPRYTPPYDLLFLYLTLQVSGFYHFGYLLLQWWLADPFPPTTLLAFYTLNLALISTLIVIVLSRPVAEPLDEAAKSAVPPAPENAASLWSWLTYGWMNPLIRQGTYNTLNEDDVPSLSVTGRSKPVFLKFNTFNQQSLPWKLFMANSLDLMVNFIGSVLSVVLNYSGPYFLRKIIRSMEDMTPERRAEAYISALLMLASQVLKALVDGQQLWALRRAATRVRSELMSAIYEKALKRRDFSGITRKTPGKGTTEDGGKTKKGKKKGKVDGESGAGADIGKIVSLMASDTSVIASLVSGLNQIYGAPFEITIACVFLYQLMGWSAFVGFGVILIVWPLNVALSRRATMISKGTMSARDKRLSVLNELINAVKPIKFFAWEDRWINRVLDAREVEMGWIRKSRTNSIMLQALWTTAPVLVSVVSFFVYVMRKNDLDVATAFTAITLFTMIKQPLNTIPTWVVQLLRTRVSVKRIETFLNEDEVPEQVSMLKRAQDDPSKFTSAALGFRHASFKWNAITEQSKLPKGDIPRSSLDGDTAEEGVPSNDAPERKFELHDLNVIFPEGKLTVVTGPTASGKTAIILALLGEMTLLPGGGDILLPKEPGVADEHGLTRSISYAAQSPWLQHLTIRENILFGSPFHEERYKEVLECCALSPDLTILEDGDETEIGARGINLSGGQKARVALARAAYARTKYVLLDDPLSAVDSPTARHLYEKLLCGPIMQNRTIVLVTHHVDLVLPRACYLIRMNDGRIDLQGEMTDLQKRGEISPILTSDAFEDENRTGTDIKVEPKDSETPLAESTSKANKGKTPKKLVEAEAREVGRIRWSIYRAYLKASFPYKVWVVAFVVTALTQGVGFIEKFWIKTWGEAYGMEASSIAPRPSDAYQILGTFSQVLLSGQTQIPVEAQGLRDILPSAEAHPLFYVGVYALIGLSTVILSVLASSLQYVGAIRASRKLFRQLLNSIVHATMRWHDTTPTGRILNRFSKDIETIDASISGSFRSVYTTVASFVASMVIVIAVFPPFVFPAVLIGYLYYRVSMGYLNTSRHLRRMESTTRSPIFSGFGELLDGIVTVRAFSVEHRFLNDLHARVDLTLKMFYYFWMTNRWLLLNFDCLGALAVFSTTIFALSLHSNDSENWAGWAALCITSAMTFTSRIYWACRYWTRLELDLNSVERIVEYLDIPQEPASIVEGCRPPAYWPSATGPDSEVMLRVQDLEVRYAPHLPSVLSDISFSVKATERIGIVGRTGSGKSTLAMSILRFIDPVNGKIVIDGIDISEIGIYDLRSRVTFIPQDATLFSGSIKDNIDPFGDYSEAECLDALRRVHMITDEAEGPPEAVEHITAGGPASILSDGASMLSGTTLANSTHKVAKLSLATEVSAGGTNFSAGQRQLIAMARAILRQSNIVILDEATSSIDFETDNKIQTAIREEFKSSLLLTIAHRLMTVIDYDRLLVLDAGCLVEFDTPYHLIKKEGGVFRDMCAKSGSFTELERIAKEKVAGESEGKHYSSPRRI